MPRLFLSFLISSLFYSYLISLFISIFGILYYSVLSISINYMSSSIRMYLQFFVLYFCGYRLLLSISCFRAIISVKYIVHPAADLHCFLSHLFISYIILHTLLFWSYHLLTFFSYISFIFSFRIGIISFSYDPVSVNNIASVHVLYIF